jgi:hypothetical protein
MRSVKAAIIACAVLCALPAAASAASGAVTDPQDQTGDNVDIKRVSVDYNRVQGTLSANFELYTAFDDEYGTFTLSLGRTDARGACVVPVWQGYGSYAGGQIGDAGLAYSVGFNNQPDPFYAQWGEITLSINGAAGLRSEFTLDPSRDPDQRNLSYSIQDLGLAGRGYDCVGDIASRLTASYAVEFTGYGSDDEVASFCFDGPCPAPSVADTAEPVVTAPAPAGPADQPPSPAGTVVTTPEAGGTAGIQKASPVPSALSTRLARALARRQLAAEFGKRYTRRAQRGHSLSCRMLTTRRAACQVRWRYRGARYWGPIAVTATSAGPRVAPRIRIQRG